MNDEGTHVMSDTVVNTTAGPIEGQQVGSHQEYLGIPFAAPPTGANRFRAPQPVTPWTTVRPAMSFGPRAPQIAGAMEISINGGTPPPVSEEECLTLNVWTPAADHERRPVMVWIHGGAFVSGAGSSPWYHGEHFADDHDIVLVSLNYRLGVLGFTYVADLGGPEFAGSGSVGIQDAAFGLQWVHDNIAAFGGDPQNVTIFGESAGAMSVGTLLALPAARGLFARAILQSGAASSVQDTTEARAHTEELLSILEMPAATVEDLQGVPIDTLLAAHTTLGKRHPADGLLSAPVVDGTVLDVVPIDAVSSGAARDVELLIGTNRDEWLLFAISNPKAMAMDEAAVRAQIAKYLPDRADEAMALYRERLADADPYVVLAAAMTDRIFRAPAVRLADAQRSAGGVAYVYLFEWATPQAGGRLGSCHALELPFVFNTLDKPGARQFVGPEAPAELAVTLNATWAAFARYGDPSKGSLGDWPLYNTTDRPTMVIDDVSRVENDPFELERRLWAN
jgi:para-nitrobenzyl esterase